MIYVIWSLNLIIQDCYVNKILLLSMEKKYYGSLGRYSATERHFIFASGISVVLETKVYE